MILSELIDHIETIAPTAYQESYDNSGLLVGKPSQKITKALIGLDCTEAVVDEAIRIKADLIITHHPILFSGIKRLNGMNYVERVLIKAIKHDIALYAIHTNLDNIHNGVNAKVAERLGLTNLSMLAPKANLLHKLVTFVPKSHEEKVRDALFEAGAGSVGNYSECSFNSAGWGTFKGDENSNPFLGKKGDRHTEEEVKIEIIYPIINQKKVLKALLETHPYEEVAYDLIPLANTNLQIGSGMLGSLPLEIPEKEFLIMVKEKMGAKVIRHTELKGTNVKRVALCGGAGSFLLKDAINAGADVFITSDYKYHQFFDAENRIVIADIGHYESEQFTMELLLEIIQKKFPTFAVCLTQVNTNPVHYL